MHWKYISRGHRKTPATLKLYQLLKDNDYNVVNKKILSNQQDEYLLLKNKSQIISCKK